MATRIKKSKPSNTKTISIDGLNVTITNIFPTPVFEQIEMEPFEEEKKVEYECPICLEITSEYSH